MHHIVPSSIVRTALVKLGIDSLSLWSWSDEHQSAKRNQPRVFRLSDLSVNEYLQLFIYTEICLWRLQHMIHIIFIPIKPFSPKDGRVDILEETTSIKIEMFYQRIKWPLFLLTNPLWRVKCNTTITIFMSYKHIIWLQRNYMGQYLVIASVLPVYLYVATIPLWYVMHILSTNNWG